jgi:hypothetical protein
MEQAGGDRLSSVALWRARLSGNNIFACVRYPGIDSLFEIELLIQPGDKRTDSRLGLGVGYSVSN